ncbi:MAG: hypothetical protein HYX94_09225 [Chloroflexi bacterium]|nr:hypothetical protein [Chloroflexota bacterium]
MDLGSSGFFEQDETNAVRLTRTKSVLKSLKPKGILVPDLPEVTNYLLVHSDLVDLLPCVSAYARKLLGADTQLSLEIYRDPEIEDEYLTFCVRQDHYQGNILELIDRVYAACGNEFGRISGGFLMTTDSQAPRP